MFCLLLFSYRNQLATMSWTTGNALARATLTVQVYKVTAMLFTETTSLTKKAVIERAEQFERAERLTDPGSAGGGSYVVFMVSW